MDTQPYIQVTFDDHLQLRSNDRPRPLADGVPNIGTWERVASLAAGVGVLALGARRGGRVGRMFTTAGGGLMARGLTGYCPGHALARHRRRQRDTRLALGGRRGAFVREGVVVKAPADALYALWHDPTNLQGIIPPVESVERLDDVRARWVTRGSGGVLTEWNAEIINDVPGRIIGWRSFPGADVAHAGSVTFRPRLPDETEVTVTLQCEVPAGRVGLTLTRIFGGSPSERVRTALRRWKQLLETGELPTVEGQPAGKRSRLFRAVQEVA
jgi:uncharacterized membrane protein